MTPLFIESNIVDISESIDWMDENNTKYQEKGTNEDIFKSMTNSLSLIDCTKTISYKSVHVSSNHIQVNHSKY